MQARPSSNWNFLGCAFAEVLKLHPDLAVAANFGLEFIHSAWARTPGIEDLSIDRKAALVTRAGIVILFRAEPDRAAEVRTNSIENPNRLRTRFLYVNRTDRNVWC